MSIEWCVFVSEEEDTIISEELIRNSLTICVFSTLDEEGVPHNAPVIIGGEELIEDERVRLLVEEGFGQLNIADLYGIKNYILRSVIYMNEQLSAEIKIVPNVFMVKDFFEGSDFVLLLITPYSDLNLSKLIEVSEYASRSYLGTHKRTEQVFSVLAPEKLTQREQSARALASMIHHNIFQRRELRGGVDDVVQEAFLSTILFTQSGIIEGELRCRKCNEIFDEGEACPTCEEPLNRMPPILDVEELYFAFPDAAARKEKETLVNPHEIINFFFHALIPHSIRRAIASVNPQVFAALLSTPVRVIYNVPETDHIIDVFTLHRVVEDKVLSVTAVADSRYKGLGLPTYLSERVFIRDLREGLAKGQTEKEIIAKSEIIAGWHISPRYKFKELADNEELQSFGVMRDASS
jgi:hypothetical protein